MPMLVDVTKSCTCSLEMGIHAQACNYTVVFPPDPELTSIKLCGTHAHTREYASPGKVSTRFPSILSSSSHTDHSLVTPSTHYTCVITRPISNGSLSQLQRILHQFKTPMIRSDHPTYTTGPIRGSIRPPPPKHRQSCSSFETWRTPLEYIYITVQTKCH